MFSKFKNVFPGIYVDGHGYKRFQNSGRLVHRYIAARMIGRLLEEGEVVHHKDGNKLNNKRTNLQVCSREQHWRIHHGNTIHGYKRRYYKYDVLLWILENYKPLISYIKMVRGTWITEKNKQNQARRKDEVSEGSAGESGGLELRNTDGEKIEEAIRKSSV